MKMPDKKYLPNIEGLKMKEKVLDPYLYKFGLEKNLGNRFEGEMSSKNKRLNRYLRYQERRLNLLSSNNDPKFWSLVNHILRTSKALRMLALMNVKPNWYKECREEDIKYELKKLNHICNRPPLTYEVTRTGIPKPDGGTRFINNPGIAWRCYLWMMNYLIGFWINPRINPEQHGHRPGKGSITCWKSIKSRVEEYPYIYEFDYKKFHDRIDRMTLMSALFAADIPEEWVEKLINLQSPYVRGLDPKDPMRQAAGIPDSSNGWKTTEEAREFGLYNHFCKGVVQGSNIAGYMGLLVLEYLKVYENSHGEYIGYADDGLLFLRSPEGVKEWESKLKTEMTGIEKKEEKSGWVKYDGRWLKPLKFVGMKFEGNTNEMYAFTHSGKYHKMEWKELEGLKRNLTRDPDAVDSPKTVGTKFKVLNFDNGQKYLGYLFSKIWSDSPYENTLLFANKVVRTVKGSIGRRILEREGLSSKWNDIGTISTICYEELRRMMACNPGMSLKPKCKKISRPMKDGFTDGVVEKAGFVQYYSGPEYLVGTINKKPHPRYSKNSYMYDALVVSAEDGANTIQMFDGSGESWNITNKWYGKGTGPKSKGPWMEAYVGGDWEFGLGDYL